ncbi:acetyl-CoA carboxylase biotin carboxylase subunit [Paenalcaligenes niemegkensis]|uniref:ATP-binding protein n=1 Tax=Paenalcaligenes niemegkensis TaxID=2895469 RepID=UPI001EE7B6AA|nr:acetyl-CoA carboxylase biotin carboxylase subunit [Paenalcaligenes niemegkensis]MCQ9618055.1 acetyl-CoA carboxylase biotin carboxylase subunit [Paenalcaligenes niemegkensis]
MGDKDHARAIAVEAGVPVLPGSPRIQADMDVDLAALANDIGYPILVKATGGGGGMGMKNVMCQAELDSAVQAALQLAGKAFGESAVFLEKYITRARHIEIQIFGYGDGDVIHLYERDCSIQRRFQKVVEESPAPEVAESIRMAMAEAAVKLAAHQRYAGPGTVEFIFDTQTQRFYFLEMNTRIQVEHPVTEMVTGLDIVRHQLELASGVFEKIAQSEVCHSGVAIECRLYAENPEKDFLPSPGLLNVFTLPETGSHCRVETGYRPNDRISPYYDPMIAKLIVWGATRAVAIEAMQDALKQSVIDGPKHNVKLLQAIMADPDYIAGKVHTAFLESRKAVLINTP